MRATRRWRVGPRRSDSVKEAKLSTVIAGNGMPPERSTLGPTDLVDDLENFSEFGTPTQVETMGGVRYFVNEFWTSRQRQ
ncbi:MAG: hypothetical protein OXG71_10550, partial [Rhodospirillales bacterium]|nr:hypothetical protein [Rhodospirillales bacterium]